MQQSSSHNVRQQQCSNQEKQDGAFMSSKEGRGRITQEFLFLFTLQAYERMMGPSKLLIGHQCQHNKATNNNNLLHKECLLIFLLSSQLNSSAWPNNPSCHFSQVFFCVICFHPQHTRLHFWAGNKVEALEKTAAIVGAIAPRNKLFFLQFSF